MVAWSVLGDCACCGGACEGGRAGGGGEWDARVQGVVPGWFGFHMLIQFLCVICRRLQRGFRAETTILLWGR